MKVDSKYQSSGHISPEHAQMREVMAAQRFGKSTCFLCGRRLGSRSRTEEHVIPKWVQKRFELWNTRLTLLNGTTIPYHQLTVPCCLNCNGTFLNQIEEKVSLAVSDGYEAVAALDRHVLFLWLGKIFYGLLYRQLFLLRARGRFKKATITTPKMLRSFETHHAFLQSARCSLEFADFVPASVLVFETQVCQRPRHQWNLVDNTFGLFISVRMGSVGLVATLQDCGYQQHFAGYFDQFRGAPLHPIQFEEVAAMISTKNLLHAPSPSFLFEHIVGDAKVTVRLRSIDEAHARDWDPRVYAEVLGRHLGLPGDTLYHPSGQMLSWLKGPDGSMAPLTLSELPWPIHPSDLLPTVRETLSQSNSYGE